ASREPRVARTWSGWPLWGGVAWEAALLFALYGLWMFAGSFTVMSPDGALPRARWLWHVERLLYLPTETSVQRLFLPHPLLIQAFNIYYDTLHFSLLGVCLVWLYVRHRDRYPRIRTTVALFTGASLLIQFIPVAPPRLLPGTGLIDTAVKYGQSVYSWHGGFDADELSAMPSVHVGWALIVAFAVITVSRSRWRWLAAGYPLLTMLVVVVTANHFWLDGIAAGLLVVLVLAVQRLVRGIRSGKSSETAQVTPVNREMSVRS
ncbi:MAG TPA: phosphatase PAP2 family protein, partial [Streptosporangiaceae bacterium]|nr:phosphatase PAP2 family protein [Streptosporangiaceae bacterium]